jgi:arginyl-tRNA synthetase
MRSCDSHLDFDLELAKQSTNENPVYYVQYAHARIHSIFREAAERGISVPSAADVDLTLLSEKEEQMLIRKLALFPEEISKAAEEWAPHRLTFYVHDLASLFHTFYNAQRILGVDEEIMKARLVLVEATRQVLANSLRLMGISAPEKM